MAAAWEIGAYKARLDSALKAERWDEAERIRIATKRRLISAIAGDRPEEVAAAREALADTARKFRLDKRLRPRASAESSAAMLDADAETAGFAAEQTPILDASPRDAQDAILMQLGGGNRRPMSTTELAENTGYRAETVARMLTQLRSQGRVVSRRSGRHMLHTLAVAQTANDAQLVRAEDSVDKAVRANVIPSNSGAELVRDFELLAIVKNGDGESTAGAIVGRLLARAPSRAFDNKNAAIEGGQVAVLAAPATSDAIDQTESRRSKFRSDVPQPIPSL